MKAFAVVVATYSEDGDLSGTVHLCRTMAGAKRIIEMCHREAIAEHSELEGRDGYDAPWLSKDGTRGGYRGPNQSAYEVQETEL